MQATVESGLFLPWQSLREPYRCHPGLGEVNHYLGTLSATCEDGEAHLWVKQVKGLVRPMKEPVCSLWSIKSPVPDPFFLLCHSPRPTTPCFVREIEISSAKESW